jgi:hypothetical protein
VPPADPISAASRRPDARVARAGWAGPAALRSLRAGGAGYVAVALRDGGYLELPGGWLLVAPARSPVGPLSVLVDALPDRPFEGGEAVGVEGETLLAGSLRIDLGGVRALAGGPPSPRAVDIGPALEAALAERPCELPELRDGLVALRSADHAGAVQLLAGRGPGLTPAGDDVLAGYAAWRHAEGGDPVLGDMAAGRSAPLGLAYLRCAERGELPQVAERLLRSVREADVAAAARHARALDGWGATSGTAILWGIAAAARGGAGGTAAAGMAVAPTMRPR